MRLHSHRAVLALLTIVLIVAPGHAEQQREQPAMRRPGLVVRLYDIGVGVRSIPEFAADQLPNVAIVVPTLDLKSGGFGELKDNFVSEVSGFLTIMKAGTYTFRLLSDDGSRLWIDGNVVIDHDGPHGPDPKDGSVELTAGEHALRVRHYEGGGGEQLTLMWSPPGNDGKFALIPPMMLTYDAAESMTTSPGRKRIIPPLRRGLPGDGTPVATNHPGYTKLDVRENRHLNLESTLYVPDRRIVLLAGNRRKSTLPSGPQAGFVFLPIAGRHSLNLDSPMTIESGTYRDQILAIEPSGSVWRVCPQSLDGDWMGAALRFMTIDGGGFYTIQPRSRGSLRALRALPGSSESTFPAAIEHRFDPTDTVPFEMLAVRAVTNGFEIEFTKQLDPRVGWEADSYYIEQRPFDIAAGKSPRRDGVRYPVKSASVSADRKKVFLEVPDLKTSHVVYLRLLPPCISEDGERPWSTEAWYTLNSIPADRYGKVLERPTPAPQNFLTAEEKAAGWKLLFDGNTTRGWRGFKKKTMPAGWQVVGGSLVRVSSGGDIVTEQEFADFELKLDWRISAAGNSGIFFHVSEDPPNRWVWDTGPEMQVLDNAEHHDGKNPKTSAGSNYALDAPPRDVTEPIGFYNQARILVHGNHVEHWLNGVKIVEYEMHSDAWNAKVAASKFAAMPRYGAMKSGHIALQDHGDKVWYRNIKIRPLRVE